MVTLQILVLPVWVRILAEQLKASIDIGWSFFIDYEKTILPFAIGEFCLDA